MTTTAINTVVKLMETLPETTQNLIAEQLPEFLADLQDEMRWDATFAKNQSQLIQQARLAKQQIAAGKAQVLDINQL